MRHRPARRHVYQTELFETETDRPSWRELPARTRETVTSLVAQLLSELSQPRQTRRAKEGEHE
jgi:hypothetical protein